MAYPSITDQVLRKFADQTTNSAQLPATVNAGDRVLAYVVNNNAATTITKHADWTLILDAAGSSGTTTTRSGWYYLDASSSIGGNSYNWTASASTDTIVIYVVFQAGTFEPGWAPLAANSATANAPANQFGTTWGPSEVMVLSSAGYTAAAPTINAQPSPMTDLISDVTTGTNKVAAGVAREEAWSTGENPGTWDVSASGGSGRTWTVVVHGDRAGVRGLGVVPSLTATTTWTTNIPSITQEGDDVYVAVVSRDHTAGDSPPTCTDDDTGGNTYTPVYNSTDRKAWLFWKKATSGTAGKTITIAGAIGSSTGSAFVLQGRKSGNPINGLVEEANASGDETHAGFTAADGSVICWIVYAYQADVAMSNGSMATLGAYSNPLFSNESSGGGDCGVGGWGVAFDPAGATGDFTWAQANTPTYSIGFEVLEADTGTEVEPSAVAATGSVQAATVSGGATVTPSAVTGSGLVQSATAAGHVTVTPSAVAATGAVQTASVSVGSTLSPTTVTPTGLVQTAAVSGGATVSASPVTPTGAVQAPTVTAGNVVNITPNPVAATGNVPSAAASAGSTVTPAAVQPEANIDDHTVTGGATVTPSPAAASGLVQTAAASGAATVTASAITAAAVVNSPTVSGAAEVLAGVLAALGVIPVPTVEAGELVVHRRRYGTVSAGVKVGAATTGSRAGVVAAGRKQGVTD